jgi:methylenetetrahydrofolate reductase (NADPH)
MHITEILEHSKPSLSFEFFPPKTEEGAASLFNTIKQLESYHPSFVSVTYHAGNSAKDLTHDLVIKIKNSTSLDPIPHLTCAGQTVKQISAIVERYAEAGVSNILALAGDPPKNMREEPGKHGRFRLAAELVSFIKKFNESGNHPDPKGFGIGVAGFPEGHPQTPNRLLEMDYLKAKAEAGADYICTQLFFDNRDFYDFCERCEIAGIHIPVIAGLMPVTSLSSLNRMAELAGGARFPAPLLKAINRCRGDAEAIERVGIQYATQQCHDLLNNNVSGIHFYTLNKSLATREIYANLGFKPSN